MKGHSRHSPYVTHRGAASVTRSGRHRVWRVGKCGGEQREKRYRGKAFIERQWAAAAPYGPRQLYLGVALAGSASWGRAS
jgi:hypothetical protein